MYERLASVIQQGDFAATTKIINELLEAGKSPNEIIDCGINKALSIVGAKFSAGECYIPEMMVAATFFVTMWMAALLLVVPTIRLALVQIPSASQV